MFTLITKKESSILMGICLLVSIIALGFLMLGDIYHGVKISLPISIELVTDNSSLSDEVNASRISRGGGQFNIHKQNTDSWLTNDWAAGLIITIPNTKIESLEKITINLGGQTYDLNKDDVNNFLKESTENIRAITLEPSFFTERNQSHLNFFKSIINWPGDFNVFLSGLKNNLPKAFASGIIISFLLFIYIVGIKKINQLSKKYEHPNHSLINLQLILVLVLTVVSVCSFILNHPSAYDWPAIDMGPFFERQADPSFLLQDFFTNASSEPNPRYIFGYLIIGINKLLGTTWYQTFFLIKSLLTVIMPGLVFLTFISFLKNTLDTQKKALGMLGMFIFTLLIQNEILRSYFTIALWSPYHISSNAQDIAVMFGFIAMLMSNLKYKKTSWFFWLITSLVHPAVGFCLLSFFAILSYKQYSLKEFFIIVTAGIILPFSTLVILFGTKHPLSANDFVYQYVTANHSFHYLPSYFTSTELSPLPWVINFLGICILLIISYYTGFKKRDYFLKNISLLGLISYVGSIALSYLFIQKFPIKLIAIIGPSRFSMMGYWIITICYARIFSYVPYKYFPILSLTSCVPKINARRVALLAGTCISLLTAYLYNSYLDNPNQTWKESHSTLVTWINASTTNKDIFVSNIDDISINLALVMQRPVFTGNGFPFREDDFSLYNKRRWLVYGSPEDWRKLPGSWDGMWRTNFYHTLTPKDFFIISQEFTLHFVVIEKNFNQAFLSYKPVYNDDNIYIYSVTDFK